MEMIINGIAIGSGAGAAFAAFLAVRSILGWVGMVVKRKYEAKALKAMGIEIVENGGDFKQPEAMYEPQTWRN